MGKAAKIAKNRAVSETNGVHATMGQPALPPGAREATREELVAALNRERNEHAATRAQREANMNQNAALIATCNEQGQAIQQLQRMVQDLQAQVKAAPTPGKTAPNGQQPNA